MDDLDEKYESSLPKSAKDWIEAFEIETKNINLTHKLKKFIEIVEANDGLYFGKGVQMVIQAKIAIQTYDVSELIKILKSL